MKLRLRLQTPLIALSVFVAGSAMAVQGNIVAGWDFSQYSGTGSLSPLTNALPANYSDLDPTFNAGSGSAARGTLYFDGSNGSSNTLTDFLPTAGVMNCERRPVGVNQPLKPRGCAVPNVDGPVRSNKKEPWARPGKTSFDAFSVLRSEGQQHQNALAMRATNNVSAVFKGDAGAPPVSPSNWSVSFGGRVETGGGDDGGRASCDPAGASECTATVSVEYSTNGVSYTSFGSVQLTTDDTRYEVPLSVNTSQTGYVRLGLTPGAGGALPTIDNVALPEPGASMSLISGVLGLLVLRRHRTRC
jgi:hypothetical protein